MALAVALRVISRLVRSMRASASSGRCACASLIRSCIGVTGSFSGMLMVSVGTTDAEASTGSLRSRVIAFLTRSSCSCKPFCESNRSWLRADSSLSAFITSMGAIASIYLFAVIGERFLRQFQGAFLDLNVLICVHQIPVDILDLRHRADHLAAERH